MHRGCIIEDGYSWCEAADASGTYVGWCSCDPASDDAGTTDAAARAGARASALAILAAFVFVLA